MKGLFSLELFCLFLVWTFVAPLLKAQPTGQISGQAIDLHSEKAVPNVLIILQGTKFSQFADENGRFLFASLPAGTYHLMAIKENFYITVVPKIQVEPGKVTSVKVDMVIGSSDSYIHMSLGGITVTDDRLLVPEDHQAVQKINSGEIEHLQATSLRDVLDFIPGIVRGENDVPGLSRTSKAQLRSPGAIDVWSLFGTQVVVDGIPLSNNANRQFGKGVGYGIIPETANNGIDLRLVPADNIESVEVMPGVSSVEYGDFTDGIIKVTTKAGENPQRIKLKNNPDTRDFSLFGGKEIGGTLVNYNLNYAYSERNLRRKGDEVKRLVGEMKFRQRFLTNDALTVMHKLNFYRFFDDDQDPSDPLVTTAYNRDYNLSYGGQYFLNLTPRFSLESTNYVSFTRRKSYQRRLEKVDIRPVAASFTPGTFVPQDTLVGSYLSELKTLGREYNLGLKLQGHYRVDRLAGWKHEILGGIEYAYDANTGEGKVFDPLRPPGGSFTIRPYSFDNDPSVSGLAFYLEDKLAGFLLRPVKLSLGIRYDLYQPFAMFSNGALVASRQGNFFNPRLGMLMKIFAKTQFRLSFGTMSKRPSIDIVYAEPYYADLLDVGVVDGDSIQLVSTYIYDRKNPDIKGYKQTKYSVGLDQEFKSLAISLTGYYQLTTKMPHQFTEPIIQHHYYYPDFSSQPMKRMVLDTVFIDYSNTNPYYNASWTKKYGLEFALNTRRIESLNLRFRVSAAYNYQTAGFNGLAMEDPRPIQYVNPGTGNSEKLVVFPLFEPIESWNDRIVANYLLDYVGKSLGIWITLSAQNVMMSRSQSYPPGVNLHAVGFRSIYGTTTISKTEAEQYNLKKNPQQYAFEIVRVPGNNWLFSLNVSKLLFPGTELSLYVINFLNDPGWYISSITGLYNQRNPEIFYGLEFSTQLEDLWRLKRK